MLVLTTLEKLSAETKDLTGRQDLSAAEIRQALTPVITRGGERGYRRRNGGPWMPQLISKILKRRELYTEGIVRYGTALGRNPELILLRKKYNRL